ncbi:hypothetical protein DIPPA_08625 [Diplonema papillatum]|nr:hypothetical protein DIPPA_08625 [Diplonema papillatum]
MAAAPSSEDTVAAMLEAVVGQRAQLQEMLQLDARWRRQTTELLTEQFNSVSAFGKKMAGEPAMGEQKGIAVPAGWLVGNGPFGAAAAWPSAGELAVPLHLPASMGRVPTGYNDSRLSQQSAPRSGPSFAERLVHVIRTGTMAERASFLSQVRLHQWETIGPPGFEAVLPFLVDMLGFGDSDKPLNAFRMIYEGAKRWGDPLLSLPRLSATVTQLHARLSRLVSQPPALMEHLTDDIAAFVKYLEAVRGETC